MTDRIQTEYTDAVLMNHTQSKFIHPSFIICASVFEPLSPASFIPLRRIAARCAVSTCDFTLDYGTDLGFEVLTDCTARMRTWTSTISELEGNRTVIELYTCGAFKGTEDDRTSGATTVSVSI